MEDNLVILLVEDDINISTLLMELLKHDYKNVIHANDGKKAMEMIQNQQFDLILLDEMLPNMLGSEILSRIRANDKLCNIPVIMMTSLKDEEHQISVLRVGADDYIHKPVRYNVLKARMETILRRSGSPRPIKIEIPEDAKPELLTPKEKEVLSQLVKGYNNGKIAENLFISEFTVSNHIKSILSKLKAESRTHAAVIALKLNLY